MSDLLKGLNPDQQRAVTHQGTPLLVLAGAGSGKTRVLTHRAAYLISQKLARASEVLLLTFTNKAASEMKNRMAKLLDVRTGHGLCLPEKTSSPALFILFLVGYCGFMVKKSVSL